MPARLARIVGLQLAVARGKSDEFDAVAATHTIMAQPVEQLAIPRSESAWETM